jgi:hypothetical protein
MTRRRQISTKGVYSNLSWGRVRLGAEGGGVVCDSNGASGGLLDLPPSSGQLTPEILYEYIG